MTRTDFPVPFDQELDDRAADELAEAFWGSDETSGPVRAIKDGVAAFRPRHADLRDETGQVQRTRAHGRPSASRMAEQRSTATIGQLASGEFDDRDEIPLTPRRTAVGLQSVDPRLIRFGILLLIGVLLVPIAMAMRPDDPAPTGVEIDTPTVDDAIDGNPAAGAAPAADSAPANQPAAASEPAPVAGDSGQATAAPATETETAPATEPAAAEPSSAQSSVASNSTGDVTQSTSTDEGIDAAATVDAAAERVVPSCPQTYEASPGDSWYRIADAAGITPSAVFQENNATLDTVILPGQEICLPAGATIPEPLAPAEEPAPAEDEAPATTEAPTTTAAPAAPAAPVGSPGRNATEAEVKEVIRSIFPESEWETAYTIAYRESRFRPTAYNGWCCYGVFQIYWSVHRSWLDEVGIDSSDDLLDPLLNVRAAHVLWQRAGNSWSPWSTYDG